MNLMQIGSVSLEYVQGVENGDLVVPVNNTLVCHMFFLAGTTQTCVLIQTIPIDTQHLRVNVYCSAICTWLIFMCYDT